MQRILTLEYLAEILKNAKLLSEEQHATLLTRWKAQEARLHAGHQGAGRRLHKSGEQPSPGQIIASFVFEIPGGGGRILTEDSITECLASALDLP